MGVRAVLPALERVHHARVFGAAIQPFMRGLSGSDLDLGLRVHEDFGTSVRRRHRAGAGGGMESADCRGDSGCRDRNLYDCRRVGGGDLHRLGSDADPDCWRGNSDHYRSASRRRIRRPTRWGTGQLLPYDQAGERPGFSLDWNLFRRAHPRNLVLVYRSSDRAACAFGQR